jgi:nucleotide-binding universal stress UspA family protein
MFKRILLPTDGSALSKQAVHSGIRLARECGAEVVGIHVVVPTGAAQLDAWLAHAPHLAQRRRALFDKLADEYLHEITAAATAEHVPSTVVKIHAPDPWLAIARAAEDMDCDLVLMASHGRKGSRARMPGSETIRVLQECRVPVLVHQPAEAT